MAYGGMHWFRPFEVFQQETSNAVMGALLLNDISNKKVRVTSATVSTVTTSTVAADDAVLLLLELLCSGLISRLVVVLLVVVQQSSVLGLSNATALTAASVRALPL
jgi:hypothetical protein